MVPNPTKWWGSKRHYTPGHFVSFGREREHSQLLLPRFDNFVSKTSPYRREQEHFHNLLPRFADIIVEIMSTMDEDSSWVNSNVDDTSMDDDDTLDGAMESDGVEGNTGVEMRAKNEARESDDAEDTDGVSEPFDRRRAPIFPDFKDLPNVHDMREAFKNDNNDDDYEDNNHNEDTENKDSGHPVVQPIPVDPDYPHVPDILGENNKVMDYGTSEIFTKYCNMKYAGKKVLRWKTEVPTPKRGLWMAQYLLFKMRYCRFHDRLKKDDFVKVRMALRDVDLDYIRDETMNHHQTTNWAFNNVVREQVLNFRVLHNDVRTMKEQGTPYLHNWLNTLVNSLFLHKVWYELYYFRTPQVYAPSEWVPCPFHLDLTDSPDEWMHKNLHDKAPISLYINVGKAVLALDIKYKKHKMGRQRDKTTVRVDLKPGDILFFNTASCAHRSAEPVAGSVISDRVYIILSGYKKVVTLDPPDEGAIADDLSI